MAGAVAQAFCGRVRQGDAYHQLGRGYTRLGHHNQAITAHRNALDLPIEKAGESLISMDWDDNPAEYGPQLD